MIVCEALVPDCLFLFHSKINISSHTASLADRRASIPQRKNENAAKPISNSNIRKRGWVLAPQRSRTDTQGQAIHRTTIRNESKNWKKRSSTNTRWAWPNSAQGCSPPLISLRWTSTTLAKLSLQKPEWTVPFRGMCRKRCFDSFWPFSQF